MSAARPRPSPPGTPATPATGAAIPALAGGSGTSTSLDRGLLALRIRAGWEALKQEPWSFWFLCAYFFIEYVRPQTIYRGLDVLPWGRTTLALTILAFVAEGVQRRRFQLLDALLIAFAGAWALSGIFAVYFQWFRAGAYIFINWLVLYYLVTHIVTTPRRFFIFLGFFLLWSLKLSQYSTRLFIATGGVPSWGVRGPSGWFQNPGELAIQMCIIFPMALFFILGLKDHLPRWKFWGLLAVLPATAALTIVMSNSRGGQLGLAAVLLVVIVQNANRFRNLMIGVVLLAGLWAVIPERQKARFDDMGDDQTSVNRTTYWAHGIEITRDYPVFGIGYYNWLPYYRRYYNPRGELPHNIFIEASSELGYTGLVALLLLMVGSLAANRKTRRLARSVPIWGPFFRAMSFGLDGALAGFVVSGFFVTVLYYPYLWVNLAFTAALLETTRRAAAHAGRVARQPGRRSVGVVPSDAPAAVAVMATRPRGPGWRMRPPSGLRET